MVMLLILEGFRVIISLYFQKYCPKKCGDLTPSELVIFESHGTI